MALTTTQKVLIGGAVTGVAVYALWRLWPEKEKTCEAGYMLDPVTGECVPVPTGTTPVDRPQEPNIPGTDSQKALLKQLTDSGLPMVQMNVCPSAHIYDPTTGTCIPIPVE